MTDILCSACGLPNWMHADDCAETFAHRCYEAVAEDLQQIRGLVREWMDRHPAGGLLHIVVDDGNVLDLDFCIDLANANGDDGALALGKLLRRMTHKARVEFFHAEET